MLLIQSLNNDTLLSLLSFLVLLVSSTFSFFWQLLCIQRRNESLLPDRNRSEERGSHANTPNRNLAGLTNHGKQVEDYLAKGIRQNAKRRKLVSGERVREMYFRKCHAEGERNEAHKEMLIHKKTIRKANRSPLDLSISGTKGLYRKEATKKSISRQALKDIAHDSNILHQHGYIGSKDKKYINHPTWIESRELGNDSDGNSAGSPSGSKSPSHSPRSRSPKRFSSRSRSP